MSDSKIFKAAVKLSPDQRPDYLEQACGNDQALRREVDSLLRAHEQDSFLEKPVGQASPNTDTECSLAVSERPGTVIGQYKLMEQIGEGGFGLVFVAEQQQPVRRKVALKVIKPGMDTQEVIARFEAERQALALMAHPHIAAVLDAGRTPGGRPYFVMELVRGIPLVDYCDQQQLTAHQRLELFLSVCQAVQHAHGKGIIHRDLKPSNIMVGPQDGVPVVKVIDFGIAKAVGQQLTDKTVYTRFNQMIGTPLYMSPEQAEINALDVDIRSDVYSLGVLLYELLTGTTPFDRERFSAAPYDEIRRIIREENPPSPSHRLSTLGETATVVSTSRGTELGKLSALLKGDLDWIVMKALEKERRRRYETTSAFADDIKRFLRQEPIEARPPSLSYKLGLMARRNKAALVTIVLVALSMLSGTAISVWKAVQASEAKADASQKRDQALSLAEQAKQSEQIAREQKQIAAQERDAALAAREDLRRVLYAAEMNLAQGAWEANNFRRVSQLLDHTRPRNDEADLRGFEWHYWNRRLRGAEVTSTLIKHDEASRPTRSVLSVDGSSLAVLYQNPKGQSVVIWDAVTGQKSVSSALPAGPGNDSDRVQMGPFSPDGKLLVVTTRKGDLQNRSTTIRFVDSSSGDERFRIEDPLAATNLRFSSDGTRLAFNTWAPDSKRRPDGGPGRRPQVGVQVWDVAAGKRLYSHSLGRDVIARLLYLGPGGKQMGFFWQVRGETACRLKILNAETAAEIRERRFAEGCQAGIGVGLTSPRLLITDTARDKDTEIVDGLTLQTLGLLPRGHRLHGAFSANGRLLAALDSNRINVWSLAEPNGDKAHSPVRNDAPVRVIPYDSSGELRFDSDGRVLTSYADNRIQTWQVAPSAAFRQKWSLPLVEGAGNDWISKDKASGVFNADGTLAAMLTNDSHFQQSAVVRIWDVAKDSQRSRYHESRKTRGLAFPIFGPEDRHLAVVCRDARFVTAAARKLHRDQQREPAELLLLDAGTGKLLRTIRPREALEIVALLFYPDGSRIAAVVVKGPSPDEATCGIVIWEVATGREVQSIEFGDDAAQLVGFPFPAGWATPQLLGFSPNGDELIVAKREGGVTFYDARSGLRRRILVPEGASVSRFGAWSVSPDGKQLAVFGVQGRSPEIGVEFYDAASGKRRLLLPLHTKYSPIAVAWNHIAAE